MATSKTLTPTNVTISIPAMTDVPDASVFSNCVDKEADAINNLSSNKANFQSGRWTPHLYDYETFVREMPEGLYIKVGKLVVAYINTNSADFSGISTMLQIRNLPMNAVVGGSIYIASLNGQGANQTIQNSTYALVRPNIVSSQMSNPSSPGWVSFMLIGYDV